MTRPPSFWRDQRGVTAIEWAILAPLLFVTVLGGFDAGLYMWRWNEAVQAARIGVRIAAVSDPVSADLKTMTGLETSVQSGQPAGTYERVCTGGSCTGGGTYDAAAMSNIFYGPQGTDCVSGSSRLTTGMCDVFTPLETGNVTVIYRNSGVDTAGVPGALRPLVTVRISDARPKLVMFGRFLPTTLPVTEMTMLAEDLRSTA
jgi:Flp pilus assembly protein TadG